MKVAGLTMDPFTNAPIVVLKDEGELNTLPIWIGMSEASAIAAELEKMEFSRPMTHDLIRNILDDIGASVEKIEVNDLKDSVYYATIYMESNGTEHKIDARPSDAIALALRTDSPIFVEKKVIDHSKKIDATKAGLDKNDGTKNWSEVLEELSPEAFGKYKM